MKMKTYGIVFKSERPFERYATLSYLSKITESGCPKKGAIALKLRGVFEVELL